MSFDASIPSRPIVGRHAEDCTEPSCAELGCREERSDCPTPLSWRDVLAEFRDEGQPWDVDRVRYRLHGRTWGSGPPLYFINGMGGTHEQFALVAWLLRDDFRCVLYDHPEECSTGRRPPRPSLNDLSDDLFAAADHHGDRTFGLFASSFGSLVALSAMLARPERIERAVLQGGFACRRLSLAERALARLCCHVPGRVRHLPLRSAVHQYNHRRWFPPFDATRWQFFLDDTGSRSIAAQAWRARLIAATDFGSRLRQISHPVLLLRSEGDGMVGESCYRQLEQGLPSARSEWLSNTGHLPQLTHPHRTARVIREFFGIRPQCDAPGAAPTSQSHRIPVPQETT